MSDNKTMAARDTVILIVVLFLLTNTLFWLTSNILSPALGISRSYQSAVSTVVQIIFGLIPLGLAFTMKNLALKIAALSIGGICLILTILQIIHII